MSSIASSNWSKYYEAASDNPPRNPVRVALNAVHSTAGIAIDLGCGVGNDTVMLVEKNWCVYAVDTEQEALDKLRDKLSDDQINKVIFVEKNFETMEFSQVNLINASFSLMFCRPSHFSDLWTRIQFALIEKKGIFCGHMLGNLDDWSNYGLTAFGREHLLSKLDKWKLIHFHELEFDGFTASKIRKHWHYFEIVAEVS